MKLRNYQREDKAACLAVFDSNCPHYFDPLEYDQFGNWLDKIAEGANAYPQSAGDHYYVCENGEGIIGCGGFFFLKETGDAHFAWGMIHASYHSKKYGTALFLHRREMIQALKPGAAISLGTSQHTYRFFEKMGFRVTGIIPSGYGALIDRYDMTNAPEQS